ncbi:MAG TPA: serine hydrolase domain-containing protein [Gemmatimonadales bacterium]|nr:serine hydrolase domain-containing protein [Gemmatimonadales bacterium]
MKRLPILLLALPLPLVAQQPDLARAADTIFDRWNSTHGPGCAVGVAQNGKTLLTRGYGMADLETGTAITPETIFESGSVAKQFTATAVVLLALDGKLSLDDPVRNYFPELPDYGRPLTIRHLLTHTSGLREWSSLVAAEGWQRGTRAHDQATLLDAVFRQKSLNYPVGDYWSYTNSGYGLAMSLVEKVSGKSFQEFTRERIFAPLGMTHTSWRDDFTRIIPGRAQAYTMEDGEWHLAMPFESVVGPGGMLTTVGDWLIWNEALSNKTLGAAWADSLQRRGRLTGGREVNYALGLFVQSYRGVPEIAHSGATGGYSTYLTRFPDRGLSIAVLCNSTQANPVGAARQLADRLITDFPPAVALDTTALDTAAFNRYLGVYRNPRNNAILQLTPGMARPLRTLPGGWLWMTNGARMQLESGAAGRPTGLRIAQPDGDTVNFVYIADKAWSPTAADLAAFVGRFRSDEVRATYTLAVKGDSLTLSPRPGVEIALRPSAPDAFGARGQVVWFERDRRGRVTTMHVSEGRMWDLVFNRVPDRPAADR